MFTRSAKTATRKRGSVGKKRGKDKENMQRQRRKEKKVENSTNSIVNGAKIETNKWD